MFCVKCGVKLEDSEKKCPLCNTEVYHPEITHEKAEPMYPEGKMPKNSSGRAFLSGAIIMFFLIPLVLTFFSDVQSDGRLDWFGYVAGGVLIFYLTFAFPLWFKKPNPVVLVPCDFAAVAVYLFYINYAAGADWYFSFALPILAGVALVSSALVTLLKYLRKGRLYVVGGAFVALGALVLLTEILIVFTFKVKFIGWSVYPLITLLILGLLLIYLAMNGAAREKIERKIFF